MPNWCHNRMVLHHTNDIWPDGWRGDVGPKLKQFLDDLEPPRLHRAHHFETLTWYCGATITWETAWTPSIDYVRELIRNNPEIIIDYSYSIDMSCMRGYVVGNIHWHNRVQEIHYNYSHSNQEDSSEIEEERFEPEKECDKSSDDKGKSLPPEVWGSSEKPQEGKEHR